MMLMTRKTGGMTMPPHKPRNALYLLPNAFTTGALFSGFYALLQSIIGNWEWAVTGIVAAAILDACDGRVARLTNTASQFGVEYDSLSDVVSFGVSPAILMFQWTLFALDKTGFAIAFFFCAATALRLARFNAQAGSGDRRYFIGLPSPAAAVLIASYVAAVEKYALEIPPAVSGALAMAVAVMMVSGIRFYSFKTLEFMRARSPLYMGGLLIFIFAFLYIVWNHGLPLLFVLLFLYVVVSCLIAAWGVVRRWW